jgi:asparagine synthase (glutamine-hydrolysing)
MVNSVELRLPFLDNSVIDAALKIPTVFKMLGVKEKFILKSAFKKVVPRHVRKRKKFGYSSPNSWIWNKPDEMTLSLMSEESLNKTGIFNKAETLKMLKDIKNDNFKANEIKYQETLAKLTCILSVQILHDKYCKP